MIDIAARCNSQSRNLEGVVCSNNSGVSAHVLLHFLLASISASKQFWGVA